MRRLLTIGLCIAVLGLASASAQASSLSLLFPNVVNVLEDNDWESIVAMDDKDSELEVGEYLVGMLYVQEVWEAEGPGSNTATTETFSAVFVLEVESIDTSGSLPIYTFKPADKNVWDTLKDSTGQNLGLTDPTADGTIGVIYSDSSDPFVDESAGDSMADAIATAYDGAPLWEVGFRGDAGEFWTALTNTTDISTLFILQVRASLNVTYYHDASYMLLKHDYLWDGVVDAINPLGLHVFSEFQGYGGLSSVDEGHFDIATDTDFYIKPTPEPGSLALLGLGLLGLGGVVYRRRRP